MLKSLPMPRHSHPHIIAFLSMAAFTLFILTFHMVEHVAQVVQKFGLGIAPAHGLIGQLDLEPVHFWFNLSYLVFLGLTITGWALCRSDVAKCTRY